MGYDPSKHLRRLVVVPAQAALYPTTPTMLATSHRLLWPAHSYTHIIVFGSSRCYRDEMNSSFRQSFFFSIHFCSNRLLLLQFSCYLPCHATSDLTPLLCSSVVVLIGGPPFPPGRLSPCSSIRYRVSAAVSSWSVNHRLVRSTRAFVLLTGQPSIGEQAHSQAILPAINIKASATRARAHCCIADCSVSSAPPRRLAC